MPIKKAVLLAMVLAFGFLSVVSGQTNLITLSELDSAKSDWPKSVIATTNIIIAVQSGEVAIPRGKRLAVLLVSHGKVSVLDNGLTNEVPVTATDIVEQINALRSHRLIVDNEQYDDYRIEPFSPATVKVFHRAGIAKIQMDKLPPELQKQFGFDPKKAEEFTVLQHQEQQRKQNEEALRKLYEKEFTDPIGVGTTGVLKSGIHIIQITGQSEMLAEIPIKYISSYVYQQGEPHAGDAVPVGNNYYKAPVHDSRMERVYIKGLSTESMIDDQYFTAKYIFKITGTKRYNTAMGGSKTVFVVEPLE